MLLLLSCAHDPAVRVPPEAMPVLPSPRGDVYTRVPARPTDPLVASQLTTGTWDEALAGAATAVALAQIAGHDVDGCEARWKAVLAGYPYPVTSWRWQAVARGAVGEEVVEAARSAPAGSDLGLVRARGADDRWVLLVGAPSGDLPRFPRELTIGDRVEPGGGWRASDPDGNVRSGGGAILFDLAGEWIVSAGGTTFPVYVGEETPQAPPVECAARQGSLDARLQAGLDAARDHYDYDRLRRDEALDSVARALLRSEGEATNALRAAGYVDVPVAGGRCEAATVERCLSQLWWSVDGHGVIVGDLAEYGAAVESSTSGVRMVLVGAG